MAISVNEIVTGRKTFFILPDTSLIPKDFLEEYFALGYECYFIEYDKRIDIKKKIDVILTLFKDVILFFNIDNDLAGVSWTDYIDDLVFHSTETNYFGVLYSKRQSAYDKAKIEKRYLYDMGLQCGCSQLEYKKKENFDLISKALYAVQAQGRRKTIRALCTSACTYTFFHEDKDHSISGRLQDISLSHFSLLAEKENFKIQLYEKIADIHFNIRGFLFKSDAILVMERPLEDKVLYVFSFVNSNGSNGLNERTKNLFVPILYNLISTNCMNLLDSEYRKLTGEKKPEIEETEE